MNKSISSGLKNVFLAHAVVGLVFGLGYLLIPATVAEWFNMPLTDEPYLRLVGAAILGFTATSVGGYLAQGWDEVKIVVQGEVVWTALAAVLSLWLVLSGTWPATGWLMFGLMALVALAFGYFYWQARTEAVARPAART